MVAGERVAPFVDDFIQVFARQLGEEVAKCVKLYERRNFSSRNRRSNKGLFILRQGGMLANNTKKVEVGDGRLKCSDRCGENRDGISQATWGWNVKLSRECRLASLWETLGGKTGDAKHDRDTRVEWFTGNDATEHVISW